ncbi:MAG TPA: right-handed parallel beta-helix repeat-containing protein [Woeseiaceae bacterium]|nr:right-handed parallel beta-helix repeat-containing protein [Woeseiaceae bacterium]
MQNNIKPLRMLLVRLPLALLPALALPAHGAVTEVSPGDDVRAAIAALQPGDELVLGGGVYGFDSRFNITVVGEPGRPVVIRGQTGEQAIIEMNTGSQNVLEVQGSAYLVLRGLTFRGGSHGIRLMDSDFITIEDCEIYETGDVALSANSGGTYEGLVIRRNHIHHTNGTGEGMYLGCNNDACRVMNSVIEWNYIHDTNRATVEQGDGIELKEGSAGNIIRHNVIHDTNYPGIITYSTVGNGPPNIIEGNLIWNTNDNGIQSAADAIIRNNIVLGSPIALQSHQSGSPSNQVVVHNTVIVQGGGINVRDVSGPVVIANNAVYSQSGTAIRLISGNTNLVTVIGNVGEGGISGTSAGFTDGNGLAADFIDAHYGGAPPIDLFPAEGSALVGAGSAEYVPELDFNGTPRAGIADAGAYRFQPGGNPGWALGPGFKGSGAQAARPNPPTDVTATAAL